jgi:hypothetical protein
MVVVTAAAGAGARRLSGDSCRPRLQQFEYQLKGGA